MRGRWVFFADVGLWGLIIRNALFENIKTLEGNETLTLIRRKSLVCVCGHKSALTLLWSYCNCSLP